MTSYVPIPFMCMCIIYDNYIQTDDVIKESLGEWVSL